MSNQDHSNKKTANIRHSVAVFDVFIVTDTLRNKIDFIYQAVCFIILMIFPVWLSHSQFLDKARFFVHF